MPYKSMYEKQRKSSFIGNLHQKIKIKVTSALLSSHTFSQNRMAFGVRACACT